MRLIMLKTLLQTQLQFWSLFYSTLRYYMSPAIISLLMPSILAYLGQAGRVGPQESSVSEGALNKYILFLKTIEANRPAATTLKRLLGAIQDTNDLLRLGNVY